MQPPTRLRDREAPRSFFLRVWKEGGGEREWRGELTPLPDGEKSFFRKLSSLPELLRRLLTADETEDDETEDGDENAAARRPPREDD